MEQTQFASVYGTYNVAGVSYMRGSLSFSSPESCGHAIDTEYNDWFDVCRSCRSGKKFDIGEFKGVFVTDFDVEQDHMRGYLTLNMKFSVDHVDLYSDRDFDFSAKRPKGRRIEFRVSKQEEHFEKGLFEV